MSVLQMLWTVASLLLATGDSLAEEGCATLAAAGDCEFYPCLDRLLGGCGSGEYPLGFGYKYCKRFQDSREMFDLEVSYLLHGQCRICGPGGSGRGQSFCMPGHTHFVVLNT